MSMPIKLIVRPARDLTVRKPDGSLLDPKGETVDNTSFWRRRLAYGDVETVEAKATKPDKPKTEK